MDSKIDHGPAACVEWWCGRPKRLVFVKDVKRIVVLVSLLMCPDKEPLVCWLAGFVPDCTIDDEPDCALTNATVLDGFLSLRFVRTGRGNVNLLAYLFSKLVNEGYEAFGADIGTSQRISSESSSHRRATQHAPDHPS